jgi:hypothetical protein
MIPVHCGDCIYYNPYSLICRWTGDHEWSTSGGCEDGEALPYLDNIEQDKDAKASQKELK